MAKALNQPQSKKCLINPSHTISVIINPMIPNPNALMIAPITTPNTTIQMASVNFAFCFPARDLPTSQRIGAIKITATTICIKRAIRSIPSAPKYNILVLCF